MEAECIGGGAVFATYAMAYSLLQEGMAGIPTRHAMHYVCAIAHRKLLLGNCYNAGCGT